MITMFDAIDISLIPSNAVAVAGYVGGSWPTFNSLVARFPNIHHLSIAVHADEDADCLDVEPWDATAGQAPAWVARQLARGVARPCIYASANNMGAVLSALSAVSMPLDICRFWSAHYGQGEHICGPATCRLVSRPMDGTQWTSSAEGKNLDQSLLADNFFSGYTGMMTRIPQIRQGSTGQIVKNWQGLLISHDYTLVVDGVFGAVTEGFTKEFQLKHGLTADGVVGALTWAAALLA